MSETALAVQESPQNRLATFAPQTFREALEFSDRLAKSTLVPKEFQGKPENILVAIQHGSEIGLPPLQALNSIAVINGRPSVFGDAALAICKAHRDWEWIQETFDEQRNAATCIVKRRGEPQVTQTFSMADAQKADLWSKSGPWKQYPSRMLKMRARGFALRDAFPDALKGILTAEEAQDYPGTTIDATPPPPVPEPQKPTDPPIGKGDKAMDWFKAYKASGWTSADAKKWLQETLKVESSFDIPTSRFDEAMEWAKTPNADKQTHQ